MFGKETTLSISQPPTFQGNASIASSRSRVTIAMRMSWQAGVLRTQRRTRGLLLRRPSETDSLTAWNTASNTKLNGLRQFISGRHELNVFGIGYYGFSDIPGLIPI